jgi:ABC-type phosphate transport system substrate-binding protein
MDISKNLYPEYTCSRNAPLECDRPTETAQEIKGAKFCLDCGFPAILPLPSTIEGQRGNYQATSLIGIRGMGRLYAGINLKDGQPVKIKEYLFPDRSFELDDIYKIQDTFKQVAGVALADGRIQNFRLVQAWEAIADRNQKRCYLIEHDRETAKTLSQYLREHPAMSGELVREVLNQVLQTLEFLHTQKIRLPNNQVRPGLAHGNLNLDSILIEAITDREFYIYLSDLALWEHLFIPRSIPKSSPPDPQQDLISLGHTITNFWAGGNLDRVGKASAFAEASRREDHHQGGRANQEWGQSDLPLREFILRLSGVGDRFESAEIARQALLKLPQIDREQPLDATSQIAAPAQRWRLLGAIGGVSLILLLGAAIWYLLARATPTKSADPRLIPSFADVNGVPVGEFSYTGEKNGTWTNVLRATKESDRTLEALLTKPKPDLASTFGYQPTASTNLASGSKPIATVIARQHQFAITSLPTVMTDELDRVPVAYDGLLVFVAASKKADSLPTRLNGQITLEQLRQIYTGKLTNWQQLGGASLPIKPLAPTEIEALQLFKTLVLKDNPEDIALFTNNIKPTDTTKTQQLILKEFDEDRTGIISFSILSKTWDQCSSYPLAIVNGDKLPIQVMLQSGKSIDPAANLCDKSNYLDVASFQSGRYPLGYPVFVVYPKDNTLPPAGAKFAELLKTRQGQCLLGKVGLVPLQPMPDKYLKSNVCK